MFQPPLRFRFGQSEIDERTGELRKDGNKVRLQEMIIADEISIADRNLLEEVPAANGAHEEDNFHRLDVGSGGDHIDCDRDAEIVAVMERRKQVLVLGAGIDPSHIPIFGDVSGCASPVGVWAKSFPLPNSSRRICTMSSARLSSLAKISVLGTSVRPGKISVNKRSRNV